MNGVRLSLLHPLYEGIGPIYMLKLNERVALLALTCAETLRLQFKMTMRKLMVKYPLNRVRNPATESRYIDEAAR